MKSQNNLFFWINQEISTNISLHFRTLFKIIKRFSYPHIYKSFNQNNIIKLKIFRKLFLSCLPFFSRSNNKHEENIYVDFLICFVIVFLYRGNFGTVRRATHKETGIKYAAKFLRRRRRATCWIKQIQHEIAVLMLSRDSKQIVKLHEVYETRNEFVLILEM